MHTFCVYILNLRLSNSEFCMIGMWLFVTHTVWFVYKFCVLLHPALSMSCVMTCFGAAAPSLVSPNLAYVYIGSLLCICCSKSVLITQFTLSCL